MIFILFITFVILLRIGELILSKNNERWLLQNNAKEYGQKHYPFIVSLHALFLASLILEYSLKEHESFNLYLMVFYLLLLMFKIWVILSLGKYWNTKIYHITGVALIKKGPYKFMKHPNYLIVIAEIAVIPLIFHLYYTALVFTILNLIMLKVRISIENKVLGV